MTTASGAAMPARSAAASDSGARPAAHAPLLPPAPSPWHRSWPSPARSGVAVRGSSSPTSRPRKITRRVSDRPISSSRSAEIEQHGQPAARASRSGPRWRPGHRRRRRGWDGRRSAASGSPISSRPMISFCWLPPDRARGQHVDAGRSHVVLAHDPLGVRAGAARGRSSGPRDVGRWVWWPSISVLPERGVQQQALAVPVLGDVADPGLAPAPGRPGGDVLARRARRSRRRERMPDDGVDQLGLAVALDAGDAERPRPRGSSKVTSSSDGAAVARVDGEALDRQHDLVGDGGLAGLRAWAARCRPSARPAGGRSTSAGLDGGDRSCRAG